VYDALKLEGSALTLGIWSRGNSTSTTAPIH